MADVIEPSQPQAKGLALQWDTPLAIALLVLAALGFLALVRHGVFGALNN